MQDKQQLTTKIMSVGTHLPEQRVLSDHIFEEIDTERLYGIPTDWMSSKMGIIERRMSPEGSNPSDLAIPAAREAIESLDTLNPDLIDLVIFCGIERDHPEPATAHRIQDSLGLKARHAFDVANACFGFMDAIEIANNYILSGSAKYALVVTGEVPSRLLKAALNHLKKGVPLKEARNILGALSVGDAGGAVILGPTDAASNDGFNLFNVCADSRHIDKCIYTVNQDGSFGGQMLMGPISNAIVRHHENLIDDTLAKLGWDHFDWMLTHQMGQKPFDRLSMLPGVDPSRMVKTFDKLGNITSATFPVNFHKLVNSGKVKSGDRIGGCFAGSGLAIGQIGYTY